MNLGKMQALIDIARYYYSLIMQTITGFGMLKLLGLEWNILIILVLVLIPVMICVVWFHVKYILPKKQEYLWKKNPVVKKLIAIKKDM